MRVSRRRTRRRPRPVQPLVVGEAIADLPTWRRAAFLRAPGLMTQPPAPRAVLLSGARQIGKTTLLLQAVYTLLRGGVPGARTSCTQHSTIPSCWPASMRSSTHGANASRGPMAPSTCCWTRPSSFVTGVPGSSIRSTSAGTGASFTGPQCFWWKPTRSPAWADGTPSG